jgi:hypothetical protein
MSKKIELELPELHEAQARVLSESRRFNCLQAGRQFGKSTLGRHLLYLEALAGRPCAYLAPSYKRLTPNWEAVCTRLKSVTAEKSEEYHRLKLINGGSITFWSADTGTYPAEGEKYSLLVFDEAALCGAALEKLWTVSLRPTLSYYEGSAWFVSTPKAGASYFNELWGYGQEGGRPDWKSWRLATTDNPYISPKEVESARADLPYGAFAQDYLGMPLAIGESAVFRDLEVAIVDGPLPAEYAEWRKPNIFQYTELCNHCGIDWAGSGRRPTGDWTAFVVTNSDGWVCHIERLRADYSMQRARLQGLCARFRPAAVLAESNSIGQGQIDELRRAGMSVQGFHTTNATKAAAVERLALAFEAHKVKIPEIPNRSELLSELAAYEASRTASGLTKYEGGSGSHDDLVTALLLSWSAGHRPAFGFVGPQPGGGRMF